MNREIFGWYSPSLNKDMPIVSYGHFGFSLLLVPTAGADYLEYERFQMIDSLAPFINSGKIRVFSVDSMNKESWMNPGVAPRNKAVRHEEWNSYIYEEVIPYIKNTTSWESPIIIAGASFGALHSMNLFLKRPDLLNGVIAMSGVYDLTYYSDGYFDDLVYYNSPVHYMSNLTDDKILNTIRSSQHIHILTGSGDYEDPRAGGEFARILYSKGIYYDFQNWGEQYKHDWPTWRDMLPSVLSSKF